MASDKAYQSSSIPGREQLRTNEVLRADAHSSSFAAGLDDDWFVEIDIEEPPAGDDVPAARGQAVNPVVDEARVLFYSMRQIANSGPAYQLDRSSVFYRQALLMKDFEDDYAGDAPFSSYFPYYQLMGYEQLRTYFTWRTRVRSGEVPDTSVSYAFLYVYELLNNIGVAGPQDGLEKLFRFWQAFRVHAPVLDPYLLHWFKDYHVYYPLETSFQDFAVHHRLQPHYPTIFGYSSGQADSFALFSGISQYDIKKSIFYNEQTCQLVNDCFYFVLSRFRELFAKQKKRFEDCLFYLQKQKSTWTPFDKALFYPAFRQPELKVSLSEREEYDYKNQSWTYKSAMLSERGKQLTGYILKEMEANLRVREKFKYKLTASLNSCKAVDQNKLRELGISFPQVIREGVADYYAQAAWKPVSVNRFNLAQIRKEAVQTQEKLIVPEDEEIREESPAPAAGLSAALPATDGWGDFREALTRTEQEALRLALQGQDLKDYADNRKVMLEVLIDGINGKAMDAVNDTVLELDDAVSVYEEYREKLAEVVRV